MLADIRLEQVNKSFGTVRAVRDLDLAVPGGSFVALLGASGCGKSTTLAMIAGLEMPDSGSIVLGTSDITRTPPNLRPMAMVFQNYALYPHMTVAENIGFSLRLRRRPRAEIAKRVQEVAETLDLGPLLSRRPQQLSGGQQQRVALGRALAKEPLVFLLDEPFSNLDAGLRARMRTEVKRLHSQLATTTIFVTHDQEEAMALADLIAVMRDGSIVQYGSPTDIYLRPSDAYVAAFVGKPRIGMLTGALRVADRMVDLDHDGTMVHLGSAASLRLDVVPEGPIVVGVRAEDVRVSPAASADDPLAVMATVDVVEPIGADTLLELGLGGARLTARVVPELAPAVGQVIPIRLNSERIHLFDHSNGRRLN